MCTRDELLQKLNDRSLTPALILSSYEYTYKPLIDAPLPINRLNGRKFAQNYGVSLLALIRQCNAELQKKQSKDNCDCILAVMEMGLKLISRIHSHIFDDNSEYYQLWYAYILRLSDNEKHEKCSEISKGVIKELEENYKKKETNFLMVNILILKCHSMLQLPEKSVDKLEEIYEIIAEKCKNILISLKNGLTQADHQNLNRIYQSSFKILFKTGKCLDNLSGGNIQLHKQALEIRLQALIYLEKTRPFISTDYFAFAYSSIQSTYKVASSASSSVLYESCINAIDSSLEVVTTHNLSMLEDKNIRNMIELQSFLYQKQDLYDAAKSSLNNLIIDQLENIPTLLYNVKYSLEIAKCSYLGKISLIRDLENAVYWINLLFDEKLSGPTTLTQSEIQEIKEITPKVQAQLECWLKIAGNLHAPSNIKQGMQLPYGTVKLLLDLLKYYPMLIQFENKLSIDTKCDWELYNYIMALHFFLTYMASRDIIFSNSALSYINQLLLKPDPKYLNSTYNISLALIHTGEKELAFKILIMLLEHMQISNCEVTTTHIAIFELCVKYAIEANNYYTHIKKAITGFIMKQAEIRGIHDIKSGNLLKIIDGYIRVHLSYIETYIQNGHQASQLVNREDILGEKLNICIAFKGEILDREITDYHKRLLESAKLSQESLSSYISEMIQNIVKILLTEVYPVNSSQYASTLLKYIEILSTCEKGFTNEWLLTSISSISGTLQERMIKLIENIKTPQSYMWNAILLLEQAKEFNENEEWISRKNLINYAEAITKFEKTAESIARHMGYKINYDGIDWETSGKAQVSDAEIVEYLRTLMMGVEILSLIRIHRLEIQFLSLAQICISKLPPSPELETKLACLSLRKSITLWKEGLTELAIKSSQEFSLYTPLLDDRQSTDIFYAELWILAFRSEISFLQGKLFDSENLCKEILGKIPYSHNSKRSLILKSYILYIKSKIEILNNQQNESLQLCKDARALISDIHSSSIQNLSLMSSISENTYYKDSNDSSSRFRFLVFPYSSWSMQNLSSLLLDHISDLFQVKSQIHNSTLYLLQGIRLSLTLGIPSLYLQFRSKHTNLQRISLTDSRITQENIKEEKLHSLHPVELIQKIFPLLFEPLIGFSDSDSIDTVQRYDSFALSPQDVECLTKYINRSVLCFGLLVLGDILQVAEYYENIEFPIAEQNYYKLARSLLRPQNQGTSFKVLKSLTFKKQGALIAKQRPGKDCIEILNRAIIELGCCENFIQAFTIQKKCCKNFYISPLLAEELANCLLILSDALLRKGEKDIAMNIAKQVVLLPHTSNPTVQRHGNYILAKEMGISNWKKAFHIIKSIGVSYNTQLENLNRAAFPINNEIDLERALALIPESWNVIALSNGRGTYNDGIHLMKYIKGWEPFCVVVGGACECSHTVGLFQILEEFANIMRLSANTTSGSQQSSKRSKSSWWQKREKLNEKLENWLDDLQYKFLAQFSSLFLGKILDEDIHILVDQASKELIFNKNCENCGQKWEPAYIYSLLNAGISEFLSIEEIKYALSLINHTKLPEEFFKKLRSIKKCCQNKPISRGPTILILDGNLIHLPWESLKILRSQIVTRLPCFSFLLNRLKPKLLSVSNTFYILNPSSDLEHTQQTFEKFFLDHENWQGIIDKTPTESEFSSALQDKDLLIYCGHSSGEQYIKGDKIKDLNVKAASLLMGCSSGLFKPCGQFEPQGIVLQYLLGGCPAIIANLWDVTDRDIDRFALEFIKRISNLEPFGDALSKARKACKLPYLIGAAPVYYGIPLSLSL
ncbi:unnamed protein product [Blepharisma stoltei]|uniref:separase n=1 Tax=Blepharisma stoltei TaxID=1481888 RepID=A0AAU9J6K9_9CILI|nr:unnamed protein product [Blepharisma stoltei]